MKILLTLLFLLNSSICFAGIFDMPDCSKVYAHVINVDSEGNKLWEVLNANSNCISNIYYVTSNKENTTTYSEICGKSTCNKSITTIKEGIK